MKLDPLEEKIEEREKGLTPIQRRQVFLKVLPSSYLAPSFFFPLC